MVDWQRRLDKFLRGFEYKDDIIGVLVCGSYITGEPSLHSDLDVHIILDDKVTYRERGNRIVDGLMIEYFANPPRQIRAYFNEDYRDMLPSSQTQFVTGKIISDETGEVQRLKDEAAEMMNRNFADIPVEYNEITKYGLWDMMDDIQDAHELKRADFDFIYYNNLNKLLTEYMRCIRQPYHNKTILGNITSETVRKKYLLKELTDDSAKDLIAACITNPDRGIRLKSYEALTDKVLGMMGSFNADGFSFKSGVQI